MTRRTLLTTATAAWIAPYLEGASPDWLRDTFRELHLDAHFSQIPNPYADFDADRAADTLAKAGFQMVSFFAVCNAGYAYYPTKLGTVHPGLKRDYTGELARALKQRGVRTLAYVSVGPERKLHREHPEWAIVRATPAQARTDMAQMCLNSPWVDGFHIPQLRELAALYNVDGFFLDNLLGKFVGSVCYCQFCRERFAAEVGGEIPTKDDDPKVAARHRWLMRNAARYAEKLHAAFPDRAFVFTHLWVTRTPVNPPAAVKQIVWEPVPPYSGIHSVDFSLEARYLSTLRTIDNFSCMATRGNGWGGYAIRDTAQFRHEAAVLLASKGRPYLSDDNYPSGNPDPAVYRVYGDVNRRTQELEPVVKDCTPVKDVAVLLSAESMWAGLPLTPARDWMSAPPSAGVAGAHRALVEAHVQFSILNSETLVATLGDYKALVIPEQRVLTPPECDAIRRFVRDGGALIVSGETNAALADVLGVEPGAPVAQRSYLRTPEGDLVQVRAGRVHARITTAKTLAQVVASGPKQAPLARPEGPGITLNTFGKGRALYCAAPIFTAYYQEGTGALRRLIAWMLETVHPPMNRRVVLENAPLNVEIVLNARGRDRVIHLLSYTIDKRIDLSAIHGVRIGVRCDARPKRLQPGALEWKDGWAWWTARPFALHDVYVLEA